MKKPVYLSPSTLNLFRECPRCFALAVREGIQRPRGPMPSITTGIDLVVKGYFNECRKKKVLPSFLAVDGKPLAARLASDFKERLYADVSSVLPEMGLERRVYVLMGVLDECLVMDDGSYAPLDHKTRASPPADVHPAYQAQMDIYCLLLDANRMRTAGKAYLVYYYPVSTQVMEHTIEFGFAVKPVDTDPSRARALLKDAVCALLSSELPASGRDCEYCSWVRAVEPYHTFEPALDPLGKKEAPEKEPCEQKDDFPDGALF